MTTHVEAAIERYFDGRIGDIKERDALGYSRLPADQLIDMRDHSVTPQFIQEL